MRILTYWIHGSLAKNVSKFHLEQQDYIPDFLFPSGGLITRDFDRLTRSDRRLTSLRNVAARSGNLIPGLFVGVTQYCVANILIIWTCQVIRDVGIQLIRFD